MNNILNKMKSVTTVDNAVIRTPMTAEQVKLLKKKLVDNMCMNVYPNQFDIDKPYRVTIRFNNVFTQYGNFKDLEIAKVVGNIASMATFGEKAIASIVDIDKVEKSEELQTWMNDPRNKEVLAKASGDEVEVPF